MYDMTKCILHIHSKWNIHRRKSNAPRTIDLQKFDPVHICKGLTVLRIHWFAPAKLEGYNDQIFKPFYSFKDQMVIYNRRKFIIPGAFHNLQEHNICKSLYSQNLDI